MMRPIKKPNMGILRFIMLKNIVLIYELIIDIAYCKHKDVNLHTNLYIGI